MKALKGWLYSSFPTFFALLRIVYWFIRDRSSASGAERTLSEVSDKPRSFNEKILYKMAYDRNPLLTTFADKWAVRDYVRDIIGSQYLCELYGALDKSEQIKDVILSHEFVIKPNHGSGACIIAWSKIKRSDKMYLGLGNNWRRYLVNPSDLSYDSLIPLMNKWLNQNYYLDIGRLPEWAYKDIEPKILIEELLLDSNDELPRDFKFFMFYGKCQMVQVDIDRFRQHSRNLYSPNWDLLPVSLKYPNSKLSVAAPHNLEEMIEIAEKLSKNIDFVRVDLYETSKGVKFGELTNYPGSGKEKFNPMKWDYRLGSNWNPNYSKDN